MPRARRRRARARVNHPVQLRHFHVDIGNQRLRDLDVKFLAPVLDPREVRVDSQLAEGHKDTQERLLWATVVALEEGASLDERLAPQLGVQSHTQARQKREHAQRIKEIIERVRELWILNAGRRSSAIETGVPVVFLVVHRCPKYYA